MNTLQSFSDEAVENAIETARSHYATVRTEHTQELSMDNGDISVLAECVELTIEKGKICVKLPLGIGKVCLPVPIDYEGKVAKACLSICTIWGIPKGVKLTISVAGVVIVSKTFGSC